MIVKCSLTHWEVKVDRICNKGLYILWFVFCICRGGIYDIEFKLGINTLLCFLAYC